MSAPTFPPGGTVVRGFKRSFTEVPIDEANGNAVSTTEFLEAAEALTTMFGMEIMSTWTLIALTIISRLSWFRRFRPRQEGHAFQRPGSSYPTNHCSARPTSL